MKRDWDLIRKILFTLEESPAGAMMAHQMLGNSREPVSHHIAILSDAKLIQVRYELVEAPATRDNVIRLTWEGHEFLDKIRQDSIWNEVKSTAKNKSLDLTFDIIGKITGSVVSRILNLP